MSTPATTRVLVTGGTGFLGSHLTRRLAAHDVDVHLTTRGSSSRFPWRLADVGERISLHQADVTDPAAVEAVISEVQPVLAFHLAAHTHAGTSWQHVDECLQTNVQGTVAVLRALGRHGCQRIVHVSTGDVYGNVPVPFREDMALDPRSPYAVSKVAAEQLCRLFHQTEGAPVVVVRPFTTYGPAQSADRLVPDVVLGALRGEHLSLTEGRQTREFTYVDDVVEGLLLAAHVPGVEGELFNLGGGEEAAVRDVVERVLALLGNPVEARFGALPGRPGDVPRMLSDSGRARARLGWAPEVTLDEGLGRTVAWYRNRLAATSPPFGP
jgi:nucleoside-diphosphate-sugar epimerase